MKIAARILSMIVLISAATTYMACDGGDGPTESQQSIQFKKLSSTWVVSSVTDANTQRQDFQGVRLTIGGTFAENGNFTYSLTGTLPTPSPWPRNGAWKFGTNPASEIIRDPSSTSEIPMQYVVSQDGTQLTLTFTVPDGSAGWTGRTQSVTGEWTFNFTKQ